MNINYYNSVEVKTVAEKSFSITQKLDQWGTKLVQPRQAAYGGRSYTIAEKGVELATDQPGAYILGRSDKFKVMLGIILKKIAAFFNAAIKSKYQQVDQYNNKDPITAVVQDPLSPKAQTVVAVKNAANLTLDCNDCCRCPCLH